MSTRLRAVQAKVRRLSFMCRIDSNDSPTQSLLSAKSSSRLCDNILAETTRFSKRWWIVFIGYNGEVGFEGDCRLTLKISRINSRPNKGSTCLTDCVPRVDTEPEWFSSHSKNEVSAALGSFC